jgi:hypothetical protein
MAGLAVYTKNDDNLYYILAWLNSGLICKILSIINPTINFPPGCIGKLPIKIDVNHKSQIDTIVEHNIAISKADWDSFETSWDFKKHPLI